MSRFNTKPIHIQVRDVHCNLIENAKIKVIASNGDILFNEKSQSGEIILDDIESLKTIHRFKVEIEHPHYKSTPKTLASCIRESCKDRFHTGEIILDDIESLKTIHRFKVEIEHPHYKSTPKTLASCIRESCKDRFHTLEFPYQTKLLVSSVYGEIRERKSHYNSKDSSINQSPQDRSSKHIDNTASQSNKLDSTQSTMPSLHDKESKLYINDNKATIPNHSSSFVRFDNPSITQAKEIDQSTYHNPPNTSIYLKAYYNQDSIPNKQSNNQRQQYQE